MLVVLMLVVVALLLVFVLLLWVLLFVLLLLFVVLLFVVLFVVPIFFISSVFCVISWVISVVSFAISSLFSLALVVLTAFMQTFLCFHSPEFVAKFLSQFTHL